MMPEPLASCGGCAAEVNSCSLERKKGFGACNSLRTLVPGAPLESQLKGLVSASLRGSPR